MPRIGGRGIDLFLGRLIKELTGEIGLFLAETARQIDFSTFAACRIVKALKS
jgi:hypothetical protein